MEKKKETEQKDVEVKKEKVSKQPLHERVFKNWVSSIIGVMLIISAVLFKWSYPESTSIWEMVILICIGVMLLLTKDLKEMAEFIDKVRK
jgi:protein-S-isoprenylcysteine O-methyltransferase Ste14